MGNLFSECCTERVKIATCVKCKKDIALTSCVCEICRILEPYEYETPNLINL